MNNCQRTAKIYSVETLGMRKKPTCQRYLLARERLIEDFLAEPKIYQGILGIDGLFGQSLGRGNAVAKLEARSVLVPAVSRRVFRSVMRRLEG